MGSGRGKRRRLRSTWQTTLPQSFPVTGLDTLTLKGNKVVLQRLAELSSAINSRALFALPHHPAESLIPAYAFVDGHTATVGNSCTCDCPKHYTRREAARSRRITTPPVREFICAHKMATIIPSVFEKYEAYEDDQSALRLLGKIAHAADDEQAQRLHEELREIVARTIDSRPQAFTQVLSVLRRPMARGNLFGLADILTGAKECHNLTPVYLDDEYSSLIESKQEGSKGAAIELSPEVGIRRELKTAMFSTDGEYRGLNPVVTPALTEKHYLVFYAKQNGDGLLIARFPDADEVAYAHYSHEDKTLYVAHYDGDQPASVMGDPAVVRGEYLAYLYPLMEQATMQMHAKCGTMPALQALRAFPPAYHDAEASRTIAGKANTRLRALGNFTGAIYQHAHFAAKEGRVKKVRHVDGDASFLTQAWESDFRALPSKAELEVQKVAF